MSGRIHRLRWPLGAAALVAAAAAVVAWARVRPGYDPYGWLVWGQLTLHGKLDTNGAPSWKPLPFLFTLPYALVGRDAVSLWMTTAVAISLSGLVFAWRVAYRLVDAGPEHRGAAHAAGLTASLFVLGLYGYPHSILGADSDTMIVALCLAAADCLLARRYAWAFWALWLAGLGRPEAWALLGLYSLWAWRRAPGIRRQLVTGIALLVPLWLAIPALTSRSVFNPATLAAQSSLVLHHNRITGTIGRFLGLNAAGVKLAALIVVGLALVRRDRALLLMAGAAALWVGVEVGFALHGWGAEPRYLYEAGAGTAVLAGVFVGRVLLETRALADPLRHASAVAGAAALLVLAAFAGSLASAARSRVIFERHALAQERTRAVQLNRLEAGIRALGSSRILRCGQPRIQTGWQSALAWDLGIDVGSLFFDARHPGHRGAAVHLYPHPYGWRIFASGWANAGQAARCRGLEYRT